MPMILEAAYAMLACARVGAIHSIVFGGFSPEALGSRIEGCESDFLITADEGLRGSKKIPLKANADKASEMSGRIPGRPPHGRGRRVERNETWYQSGRRPVTCASQSP